MIKILFYNFKRWGLGHVLQTGRLRPGAPETRCQIKKPDKLKKQIITMKKNNPDMRVYLGASNGKEGFYRKFGFIERKDANLGAGMILDD